MIIGALKLQENSVDQAVTLVGSETLATGQINLYKLTGAIADSTANDALVITGWTNPAYKLIGSNTTCVIQYIDPSYVRFGTTTFNQNGDKYVPLDTTSSPAFIQDAAQTARKYVGETEAYKFNIGHNTTKDGAGFDAFAYELTFPAGFTVKDACSVSSEATFYSCKLKTGDAQTLQIIPFAASTGAKTQVDVIVWVTNHATAATYNVIYKGYVDKAFTKQRYEATSTDIVITSQTQLSYYNPVYHPIVQPFILRDALRGPLKFTIQTINTTYYYTFEIGTGSILQVGAGGTNVELLGRCYWTNTSGLKRMASSCSYDTNTLKVYPPKQASPAFAAGEYTLEADYYVTEAAVSHRGWQVITAADISKEYLYKATEINPTGDVPVAYSEAYFIVGPARGTTVPKIFHLAEDAGQKSGFVVTLTAPAIGAGITSAGTAADMTEIILTLYTTAGWDTYLGLSFTNENFVPIGCAFEPADTPLCYIRKAINGQIDIVVRNYAAITAAAHTLYIYGLTNPVVDKIVHSKFVIREWDTTSVYIYRVIEKFDYVYMTQTSATSTDTSLTPAFNGGAVDVQPTAVFTVDLTFTGTSITYNVSGNDRVYQLVLFKLDETVPTSTLSISAPAAGARTVDPPLDATTGEILFQTSTDNFALDSETISIGTVTPDSTIANLKQLNWHAYVYDAHKLKFIFNYQPLSFTIRDLADVAVALIDPINGTEAYEG